MKIDLWDVAKVAAELAPGEVVARAHVAIREIRHALRKLEDMGPEELIEHLRDLKLDDAIWAPAERRAERKKAADKVLAAKEAAEIEARKADEAEKAEKKAAAKAQAAIGAPELVGGTVTLGEVERPIVSDPTVADPVEPAPSRKRTR